jgi:hypothetical protein
MIGLVLYPIAAALAWAAAGWKIRLAVRHGRTAPSVAVVTGCVMLGVAYSSTSAGPLLPSLWRRVDVYLGEDFKPLLQQLCVMGFAASLLVLLVWAYAPEQARQRLRRQMAGVAATLSAAVVLYVLARPHYSPRIDMPWETRSPLHLTYTLLYLPVLTAMLARIVRLSWHYARAAGRSWLRVGLGMLAAGTAIGVVYAVVRLVQVLAARTGLALMCLDPVAQICAAAAGMLSAVGVTATSWGPASSRAVIWAYRLWAYRRLQPLWLALQRAAPQITLDPPPLGTQRRAAVLPPDLDLRLARRVIAIRDGRLAVRDWLDARVADAARSALVDQGLAGDRLDAAVEAALLKAAVAAKTAGARTCPASRRAPDDRARFEVMDTLADETTWLVLVSAAFRPRRSSRCAPIGQLAAPS